MPKVNNQRLTAAKQKRNETIRLRFDAEMNRNLRIDYIIEQLMDEYGLAYNTIWAIVKKYGYYADN